MLGRLWAARLALRTGDAEAAARESTEARVLDPKARTIEIELGLALARGDRKSALEAARRLDEESGRHRWARQVVDLELELGELDRAAVDLSKWTARFPSRSLEAIELARRLHEIRKKEEAPPPADPRASAPRREIPTEPRRPDPVIF